MEVDPETLAGGDSGRSRRKPVRRPLFDANHPQFDRTRGFVRYPYYRVREVAEITGICDDKVRDIFRSRDYGEVIEVYVQKKGRRAWRMLLIPYDVLIAFLGKPSN